jgi:hypothetical protein
MKKSIALLFAASTLILAGCCTTHHATAWEYEIVSGHLDAPRFLMPNTPKPLTLGDKISLAAAEGWQVVSTGTDGDAPFVILRRPK